MAVSTTTRSGLRRFRAAGPGSRVALVAPASPFAPSDFERGVQELERLGFVPVYDDRVFERQVIVAGSAEHRAGLMREAWTSPDVDVLLAVRGGYGSVETLPLLHGVPIAGSGKAFVGYSDVTSVHSYLTCHMGMTSVHGAMLEGRLAGGPDAYDVASFLGSLSATPLGELAPAGLEVIKSGEAIGPIFGGTLTQLAASLGTPFAFTPPAGHVLLIDEVGERPYRIRRMLMQMKLAGLLARAAAVVVGQLPRCDEPGGLVDARAVIADILRDFPGPVLLGFPTGHTTTPSMSIPLGVTVRVAAGHVPALVFEEAAAA